MLTKGAIGNLVNKYRAVLKKCGLLNTFGSLAVAGALVLGGAGMAAAADPVDWNSENNAQIIDGDDKIATGEEKLHSLSVEGGKLVYTGTPGGGAGQLFIRDSLNISGGEFSVNHADHAGIQGAADHDNLVNSDYNYTATLTMNGGTLNIDGSQVQMKDVNISGGEVSISGIAGTANSTKWDDGAMLGALGGDFSLSGGTVTLGDNAQLFAPRYNLNGGTIEMNGSADKDALVRAYGDNGSLHLNGTTINVTGQGVLSAAEMNIADGTLNVDAGGKLTMGIGTLEKNKPLAEAVQKAGEAVVTQTGGVVNVAGTLNLGGTLNIEGGAFNVAKGGGVFVLQDTANPPAWGKNSAINMRGGVLNVNGYAEASQLAITGGTTNITGDENKAWHETGLGGYNQRWDTTQNKWVAANGPTTVSGPDTVVNIKSGNLFGGVANAGDPGGLAITNGATVNLFGDSQNTAGMLFASNAQALNIDQGAMVKVADGQHGVFNAETTNISSGATVSTGGVLTMAQVSKDATPVLSSSTVTVGNGGTMRVTGDGFVNLAVDGATSSTLNFEKGSLFDVSAASVSNGNTAIRNAADNVVNVADGAQLRISGAKAGESYKLTDNDKAISPAGTTGWQGDNLLSSTSFLDFDFDPTTGEVKTRAKSAAEAMPALDGELGKLAAGMYAAGLNDYFAAEKGRRFLSRATDGNYIADAKQAATTIESAARMALIGAVPQMTMAAHNAAGAAVSQRTGLARPEGGMQSVGADGRAADNGKTGFAMWIMPLYQSANGWGMEGGSFNMDYSGGLGGMALGADYTFAEAIRAGIAFHIGGGYAEGSGDFNKTTNDMSFWGIGAYLGWTPGNFGLTADVQYTSTYNKLEQELPAGMQMRDLRSDVTAWALSAGLRGEYRIETGMLDIIPHVGVRYMSLNTDEYDVKSEGTLLKGDAINQNIWTFPVGVAFSKRIETGNGWHIRPSLDLAVIPAAGDIKARGDVRFTGVNGTAELETQTMDYISYMGQAGLEFGNDNVSLGVNYNLQTGAHSTAHGVFGTFRYEF